MISAQNIRLPTSNADLHSAAAPVLKPTCAPDDGSNAGPWTTTPASSIDGMDKRVVRAALLTGRLSVSDLMEPEAAT